jgi:hypothetical protein
MGTCPPNKALVASGPPRKGTCFGLAFKMNLKKYKTAEIYQNAYYRDGWQPCISFEKDILYMIEAINK